MPSQEGLRPDQHQGATPLEAAAEAHELAAIVIGHKGALVPHEKLAD